jgi:PPM family protein phosphatase
LPLYDWYAISDAGARLKANHDTIVAEPGYGVFLVADGMGGRPAAAQASQTAARAFMDNLRSTNAAGRLDKAVLAEAVAVANKEVGAIAEADPSLAGAGTTLTALVLGEKQGRIVHVGDSRVYCYSHHRLEQLTEDHTVSAELAARLPLDAATIDQFDIRHVLSRAVGTRSRVTPDIVEITLQPHEWFLIATDGLYNTCPMADLQELMAASAKDGARAVCRAIIDCAMEWKPADNLSLVVVRPLV